MRRIKQLKTPFILSVLLIVLCGFVFPVIMTGISQVLFNKQANGSLITINDKVYGSELVGQYFTDERFMKSRPSAIDYNTAETEEAVKSNLGSGSDNLALSNEELARRIEADVNSFLEQHPDVDRTNIPVDLVTQSGSGLDPDISLESAKIQLPVLVEKTGISEAKLEEIIDRHTKGKFLGVFGEKRVNVLLVNIEIAKELKII